MHTESSNTGMLLQCVNDTHPVYSQGKAMLTNDLDH